MAVVAIFTGRGITKDDYQSLRDTVGWERQHPKGVIFHAASFDDAGDAHVVDVWASPEELNAFVSDHLMPAMQRLNMAAPDVTVFPAYNINAYPAVDEYKV
jgi:hypothetical protein